MPGLKLMEKNILLLRSLLLYYKNLKKMPRGSLEKKLKKQ
jgi:hypothetical protein